MGARLTCMAPGYLVTALSTPIKGVKDLAAGERLGKKIHVFAIYTHDRGLAKVDNLFSPWKKVCIVNFDFKTFLL